MPNIGDVVGVEVTDPFDPDADPVVAPGLVVNVEGRPDGEDGPDVVTAVVFDKGGNSTVHQVSEGGGLTSLSNTTAVPTSDGPSYAGQADTDTVGDGTNPQGLGSTSGGSFQ